MRRNSCNLTSFSESFLYFWGQTDLKKLIKFGYPTINIIHHPSIPPNTWWNSTYSDRVPGLTRRTIFCRKLFLSQPGIYQSALVVGNICLEEPNTHLLYCTKSKQTMLFGVWTEEYSGGNNSIILIDQPFIFGKAVLYIHNSANQEAN